MTFSFDGDITFYLNSGLEIRVPNDQFIVPFVDIDRNGSRIIKQDTRELLMNGLGDQPATLGRYFFTSAYLMVNHDAGTFTLWQANPTKKGYLVRVFDEETASQCSNASGVVQPSASSTSTSVPAASQGASEPVSKGPSGVVIGGAIAGVVAGMAIIAFGVFYFIRRKRRQAQNIGTSTDHQDVKPPEYKARYQPHEVYGSLPTVAEVQGQNHFVYEMDANVYTHRNK